MPAVVHLTIRTIHPSSDQVRMRFRLTIFFLALISVSCAHRRTPFSAPTIAAQQVPRFEHVFVVVEENQSYDDVIGNTADMPYLNMLATNYGLATNYYANAHPSINNYF